MEDKHTLQLKSIKDEKDQLQVLVARQNSIIEELEKQLVTATVNNSVLQKQQHDLMETVHNLLTMISTPNCKWKSIWVTFPSLCTIQTQLNDQFFHSSVSQKLYFFFFCLKFCIWINWLIFLGKTTTTKNIYMVCFHYLAHLLWFISLCLLSSQVVQQTTAMPNIIHPTWHSFILQCIFPWPHA